MPFPRPFANLSIRWKLLLTSIFPVLTLIILSVETYQSVQTYSEDEERLGNIYFVQRKASDYMRLVVDLETGFRGYVLTQQPSFLLPYRMAQDHILEVGTSITDSVEGRTTQMTLMREVQGLVVRLMKEKDELISAIKAGRKVDAIHYVEAGRGRDLMKNIREKMNRFDQLEQALLNEALGKIGRDRSSLAQIVLGGGALTLLLLLLGLLMIARSITTPLVSLAEAVEKTPAGAVPQVPVIERGDEIGSLSRALRTTSTQLQDHVARLERSEMALQGAYRELSASESKYRDIVTSAPLGIFTLRGRSILFSNRENRMLAGIGEDRAEDFEAYWQAIHPDDRDRIMHALARCQAEQIPFESVFRFLHADGTVRIVLSRAVPIYDSVGIVVAYQGLNVDITAREQMQELMNRSKRLATLGQVAAGIAHEIRNPLVGIGSNLTLVREDMAESDPQRAEVDIVLREVKRLDRIVNQIVEFARPRGLMPQDFAMEQLVGEVLSLLDVPIRQRHIVIDCQFHPTLSSIYADRDQIKQVLLNVVQNAVEAMEKGGKLRIVARNFMRDFKPGLLVEVVDQGKGIAPEDLSHVFEPFFTKGKVRGSGLGLAISQNLIEAHQGYIQTASQPGIGTTMTIWLPLRHDGLTSERTHQ
ncbi:hypothetical protein YTPLAS18_14470 [Nitrospira sp.]|nr:hypothetical protein YTPLAS18_14470 [Nitrospira sp.]